MNIEPRCEHGILHIYIVLSGKVMFKRGSGGLGLNTLKYFSHTLLFNLPHLSSFYHMNNIWQRISTTFEALHPSVTCTVHDSC
jgi:hypothetical protein